MNRRAFLTAAGLGSLAALLGQGGLRAAAQSVGGDGGEFSWDILKEKAKALTQAPYLPPGAVMPEALKAV
jgi:glucan biosynthesis protein